jgi:hypothetical protein
MVMGQGAGYYAEQSLLGVFSVSQIQVNMLHPQEFGHVALYVSPCLQREREREREKLPCTKPAELPGEKEGSVKMKTTNGS